MSEMLFYFEIGNFGIGIFKHSPSWKVEKLIDETRYYIGYLYVVKWNMDAIEKIKKELGC